MCQPRGIFNYQPEWYIEIIIRGPTKIVQGELSVPVLDWRWACLGSSHSISSATPRQLYLLKQWFPQMRNDHRSIFHQKLLSCNLGINVLVKQSSTTHIFMVYTTHKHANIGDGGSYCFTSIRLVVISDASDSRLPKNQLVSPFRGRRAVRDAVVESCASVSSLCQVMERRNNMKIHRAIDMLIGK